MTPTGHRPPHQSGHAHPTGVASLPATVPAVAEVDIERAVSGEVAATRQARTGRDRARRRDIPAAATGRPGTTCHVVPAVDVHVVTVCSVVDHVVIGRTAV